MSGFQVQNASDTTGLRVQIRVLWDKDSELDVEAAQELMIGALPAAYMELEKRINAARKAVEAGPGEVPGDAGPGAGEGDREAEGARREAGSTGGWLGCSCPIGTVHRLDCRYWEIVREQDELRRFGPSPVALREQEERRRFREHYQGWTADDERRQFDSPPEAPEA